jgi:hypothetical protein
MQMAASRHYPQRKTKARSRVTNGKSLFPKEVDQRTLYYRRFRDLIDLLSADLGGADLSTAEQSIVRTAATHMVALEQLELQFALADGKTKAEDLMLYQTLSNSLRRLLKELGIKRKPRDLNPQQSPRDYLRSRVIDHDDDPPRINGHHRVRAAS